MAARSPLPVRRCPKTFEENKSIMGRDRDEELRKMLSAMESSFKEGDVIMEHGGVNQGTIVTHLAPIAERFNCSLYGVENCESIIEYAKEKYSHPRVQYILGELTDPNFELKEMKFNKIFSIYYLQFLTIDYKEELKAMYNLLAPGREVILVLGHSFMCFDLFKKIREHENWVEHGMDHMPDMTWVTQILEDPEGWTKEVQRDTGFKVNQLLTQKKNFAFDKLAVIADMFFSYNTFAHHLPEEEKNSVRDEYIQHFIKTETELHKPSDKTTEHNEYKFEYDTFNIHLIRE